MSFYYSFTIFSFIIHLSLKKNIGIAKNKPKTYVNKVIFLS